MKKKVVFIIIYVLLCLAPLATVPFSKDTSATEKRTLSAFPEIMNEGKPNLSFFTEFDAWFTDHMGGRAYLVEAQTALKEKLFYESAESSVILGSNDWLFYEKTADDYSRVQTVSDRNINNIATTLLLMQEYCEERGAEFIFTVAPNKNTLYPDNMPAWYIRTDGKSNLMLLTKALSQKGVHYADLRAAFGSEQKILYQPRDSHWTYEGGMLAYRTIVSQLNSKHDLFKQVTFTERADWDADLVNMIYPNAPDTDLQSYPEIEYTFSVKGAGAVSDEALVIETTGGAGEGTLLMFRDSFGNTTWRYFAQAFRNAEFERAVPYRMSGVDRLSADTVILEIVERNLINLAEKAPMMEAPKRELTLLDAYDISNGNNVTKKRQTGGFLHLYGTVDASVLGREYRVYAVVKENGATSFYEACPIYEKELLDASLGGDNGFSCYLPESAEKADSLGILVESSGRYCYFPVTEE